MKEILLKLGGPILLLVLLFFIGYVVGGENMKKRITSQLPPPVHTIDTILVRPDPDTVRVERWHPAIIIRDTVPPAPSPAYVAMHDTTIAGIWLHMGFLHPEKVFKYTLRPPDIKIIKDTVFVPAPILVKETDWDTIWKVGVVGLAVGYIVGEALND